MSLDWPNQPSLLTGRNIEVEWKHGKMYKGKVTAYNPSTKRFTILYDDQEEKEYDLFTKTFKIEGETQIWTPEYSRAKVRIQSTNSSSNFALPYTPRIPGASTLVNFAVVIDPRLLETGDRIVINGNLPQFTEWRHGVEMIPSEDLHMWSISLELPFSLADSSPYGIFRYRYEILTRSGNIIEGNMERSEQQVRTNYYHFFRGNFRYPRFRGWTTPHPRDIFQFYCQSIVAEFSNGEIGIDVSFKKYANLMFCFPDSHRSFVEASFEESLQNSSPPFMLCALYLGMIGAFGLTSEEKVYVAGNGAYSSYSYVGGVQVTNPVYSPYGTMTKRKPPKPTVWVCYCAIELDVAEFYKLDWPLLFGSNFRWISRGIVEAIERLSEHGSYDWLRIIPLASKFSFQPRIVHLISSGKGKNSMTKDREVEESFLSMAKNICNLISEQLYLATLPATVVDSQSDSIGLANLADSLIENEFRNESSNLARDWVYNLVVHAPSLSILSALLLDVSAMGIAKLAQDSPRTQLDVIEAFRSRLEDEELTIADFKVLESVLRNIPFLLCPQIAIALLKNPSCDFNVNILVVLIEICLQGKDWKEVAKDIADASELNTDVVPSGLVGVWHELNSATKEFFSRKHGNEPPPEMVVVEERKDTGMGWGFANWGSHQFPEKRPKRLTEEELLEQYKMHINLALLDIESLLTIPFFAANPNGLLFEFGRCWFSKSGTLQQSLSSFGALCSLGSRGDGFRSYHPQLADYLENRILKQLKDLAVVGSNVKLALGCVRRNFSNDSPLGHQLLYHLAQFLSRPQTSVDLSTISQSGPPELRSLLENHDFWRDIHHWVNGNILESMLVNLLKGIRQLFTTVITSIEQATCTLSDMHIIMDNSDSFFELIHVFGLESNIKRSTEFSVISKCVREFDIDLEHLQTYVSFFCSCGVKIDAIDLRKKVEALRIGYNSVMLCDLKEIFSDVKVMPFVSWLYQLRGSELFLQEWRRVGREISIDNVAGARSLVETDLIVNPSVDETSILTREADEDDQTFGARIAALEAIMLHQARVAFEEQDRRNTILSQIDSVELSQEVVVEHLIPAIQKKWSHLAKETFTGQLTISQLDSTFATLITNNQIAEELRLLYSTSELETTSSTLLEKALSSIKDYYFLKKLHIWLPALVKVRDQLQPLFPNSPENDLFRTNLQTIHESMLSARSTLTLAAIPDLISVSSLRGTSIFSKYSPDELDFLSALSTAPDLISWLLAQNSTEEFNRLLQVVRPCTDEPRMLSAIASLVHIRTILIQVFYVNPPYDTLALFLDSFSANVELTSSGEVGNALWHLNNIISTFDCLMEVFQKQTRSPGIKACFDLRELRDRGVFLLQASSDPSQVLTVEFLEKTDDSQDRLGVVSRESIEYLYDLRSKLLMTEIPPELDEEIQASAMVESFIQQLQILSELSDVVVNLSTAGHIDYQEGFEMRIKFTVDGLNTLNGQLVQLQTEASRWESEVKLARINFYHLNFFTMQELLRIRHLLTLAIEQPETKIEKKTQELPSPKTPRALETENEDILSQMEQMGFSREWSSCALRRSGNRIESAIDYCLSNSQMMDRYVAEESALGLIPSQDSFQCQIQDDHDDVYSNSVDEIHGLLHLVSSAVDIVETYKMIELWKELSLTSQSMLLKFGNILASLFDQVDIIPRQIGFPDDGALNKADMLILLDDEMERRLPIFVTCAQSPLLVIDTVLSVYVRRARLPEPGEVIFCTNETTLEDLNLILLRFIFAKKYGRGSFIFCIADLHNLSYTLQCNLVEKLRLLFVDHGHADAATLLLVSGLPRQVALNTLSSHAIDLPPLEVSQLRKSCNEAFQVHSGYTECVASTVNGGGKSHYILGEVANRQLCGEPILYKKIPFRESTNSFELVSLLSSMTKFRRNKESGDTKMAFHIDIAHIIPPSANTMLFQLLLIGVLRCPKSSRVYYRDPSDMYLIEVPNSPKNKTILALRFCNLLPHVLLSVSAETLQLSRPVVQSFPTSAFPVLGTSVVLEEYLEITYVCKWLRAINSGRIQYGGASYDQNFTPWEDRPITKEECFELLSSMCCKPGGSSPNPSWSLFHSVIMFMNMQFLGVEKYTLFRGVLDAVAGLENFKHVFVGLLVETSIDFSLRSVPQLDVVGPLLDSRVIGEETLQDLPLDDELPDLPPAPVFQLQTSSELRRATQELNALNPPGMVRQTSEEVVRRFQKMLSWEESEHPVVLFKMNFDGDVDGVDILSLNSDFVDRYIHGDLKRNLEENYLDFNRDWSNITNEEGVEILRNVEGLTYSNRGGLDSLEPGYVMTVDNLLKMLSIQLRLRFNLPVVIMGETGCGKSTLIRNMCAILGTPLHILNIHGGMGDEDIVEWMSQKIIIANRMTDQTERIVIFLDEINTCNCMGLFKEIVCDRSLNGQILPFNIKIIAACNPYRLRATKSLYGGEEMAGLAYEHFSKSTLENVGTGIKDPLRNLVYRVHPLPESMIDHVFDFGALSAETESLYVKAMLRKQLGAFYSEDQTSIRINRDNFGGFMSPFFNSLSPFDEFVEIFSELICEAQECIRQLSDGERSATSLRDVSRCVQVFIWFGEHLANTVGCQEGWTLADFFNIKPKAQKYLRKVLILSLAYCYHARLPREERRVLVNTITNKWRSFQINIPNPHYAHLNPYGVLGAPASSPLTKPKAKCRWLNLDFSSFISILEETQREFVSMMNLGEGIALNEALCENLFMILCSVLNQIPIFVIGKPGSSKSLAMGLIQSNLNGDASENDFLRSLPAVEVFSYQCSPLSTSLGIEQAFESARRYKREASNTVVVILLDEVGLAEQSPHLPLKVLHKMLDEAGGREAVVGISNWSLDPAKMNRAVHLYRPAPTVDDLSITAEGMVRSANLKGYLHELARAYNEIYHSQEHPDFWGLREFYSTVRAINTAISSRKGVTGSEVVAMDSEILLNAILRNFGGRPQEMDRIIQCFFLRLGLPSVSSWRDILIEDLIKSNLTEPEARHLMLLTKNNAALSLLLDRSILMQDKTEIIFGSDFPLDQNDLQVCINIQRVKLCMAEGITTVLVHCESLYESLYDLLNQHYVEYGGQIYVRLAFGTYTRLCPIHKNFRIVVIVEKEEAYTRLAPPLLNRFEKQVFERSNVLLHEQKRILSRLQRFSKSFASVWETRSETSWSAFRATFCGYHSDMLSSLILATQSQHRNDLDLQDISEEDFIFAECVKKLLWITTPEATCRLMTWNGGKRDKEIRQEYGIDCSAEYFQAQCHSSLPSFVDRVLPQWSDKLGTQVMLMTYSALSQDVASVMRSNGAQVTHIVLHELGQERELRQSVSEFFKNAQSGSTLLLQCDPLATSRRRIEHSKFLIELSRARRLKQLLETQEQEICDGEERKDGGGKNTGASLNIHVILLIHLPRGETSSESTFNIDFDTRWAVAFLDSIQAAETSGLPDAASMIGRSLSDIFMSLDAKKVLAKTFRFSLSKMVCLFDRSNDDVRRQISNVTKCLNHLEFVDLVQSTILKLIHQKYSSNDLDITSSALSERELQLAGSFQGALHRQILGAISTLFAVVLSHMDRNNNLALFLGDKSVSETWIYLFQQSFNESTLLSKIKWRKSSSTIHSRVQEKEEVVEVKSDALLDSTSFSCRFPFSFFLIPMIDTMRKLAEDKGELFLQRQLESMCFDKGIFDPMERGALLDFVHDFTCMKLREIPKLSRKKQAEIVLHLLTFVSNAYDSDGSSNSESDLANERSISQISQLHSRFWTSERILELYFDILHTDVIPLEVSVTYLLGIQTPISCNTHFGLMQLIFDHISPMQFSGTCQSAYKQWFALMHSVRASFLALVDLLDDESLKFAALISWKKLDFLLTFLRDVCMPLDLSMETIRPIFSQFPDPFLANSQVFRSLLVAVNSLNFGDGVSYELLCPITLEKLTDPVIAADGFTYERSVIEAWFSSGKVTSPSTNEPLSHQRLIPNRQMQKRLESLSVADLSRFVEYYIFDVLFCPLYRDKLDDLLIDDLLCFISGQSFDGSRSTYLIKPSEKFIEGVLREIFKIYEHKERSYLNSCIEKWLRICSQNLGSLDTPLSVAFVVVTEEICKATDFVALPSTCLCEVESSKIGNISLVLSSVAQIRSLLEQFSDLLVLSLSSDPLSPQSQSKLNRLTEIISPLLEDSSPWGPHVRLMRVYFLKLLNKSRGLSYVRGALLQLPLSGATWVSQWKLSDDAGFTRFLGSNRLPQINPFVSFPCFPIVQETLCNLLHSGDVDLFDSKILETLQAVGSGTLCGALLLAAFHEVGLLALLPQENTKNLRSKLTLFEQWLFSLTGAMREVPEMYKKMIIAFGLGKFSTRQSEGTSLFLDEASSTESILRTRFIVHVVAVAMQYDSQSHPLRYLHTLIFCPKSLQNSFFPTMPEDLTKMAQNVMGGRWYACPNNHPFYVDLCGRPTLIQTCAECGAQIGGENHNLLDTNKDLGNVGTAYYQTTVLADNSERNYCGRTAAQENQDRFYTTRTLSATSVRVLRLFLNSALLCGASILGSSWCQDAQSMMNSSYTVPDDLPSFFAENVSNDLTLLRSFLSIPMDDVALLLHVVLSNSATQQETSTVVLPAKTPQNEADESFASMSHPSIRDYWEEYIDKLHIQPLTSSTSEVLTEKLAAAHRSYGGGDQLDGVVGLFANELQERLSLASIDQHSRSITAPGLWRLAVSFSYEEFLVTLKQIPHGSEKYPLLSMVTGEDPQQLAALRHIPAVLEWFRLLRVNYNGLIDRDTARSKTNDIALGDISRESSLSLQKYEQIFQRYCLAWNDSWSNVLRFGCIKFSSDYNSLRMSNETPLSFSLPNEHDEGNCPLSLIHYLIEKHNTYAQRVDESLLLRSRMKNSSGENMFMDRVPLISSRFLTSAHTIRCDLHQDLLPLLEKHCLSNDSQSGRAGFDFVKAENLIIDRFLSDIPAVDLEMPGFRFAHEQYLQGGMSVLRQKIKQHPLPLDIIRAIQREVNTPVIAQQILELVEQAISFLSTTGGSFVQTLSDNVGDMSFGKYIKVVLLLDEVTSSRVVAQQVQLKHLEALWTVLSEITNCDVFSGIHAAYKASLQARSKSALSDALKLPQFNPEKILTAMKSFMLENLQEQTISPSVSIHLCLINLEIDGIFLGDADWFLNSFPECVPMAEIVDCFEFIKEGQLV